MSKTPATATITIGTATAQPGQIVTGTFDGVALPTGGVDTLPIIIAQGDPAGPIFWITGSIHGNELSGLSAIHKLLGPNGVDFPLDELTGTGLALWDDPSFSIQEIRVHVVCQQDDIVIGGGSLYLVKMLVRDCESHPILGQSLDQISRR